MGKSFPFNACVRSFHYSGTNSGKDGSLRPRCCKSTRWCWLGCPMHRLRKVTPLCGRPSIESCAGSDSDAQCMAAYDRRPLVGDAALHRTGSRAGHPTAQAAAALASAAAPAHQAPTSHSIRRGAPVCGADFLSASAEGKTLSSVFSSLLRKIG